MAGRHGTSPTTSTGGNRGPDNAATLDGRRDRRKSVSQLQRLFRNRLVLFGTIAFILVAVAAVAAPLIAPRDPQEITVVDRLRAPDRTYLFGTDHLGRDVFSRVVYGARISLLVGFSSVIVSTLAGVLLGAVAGYVRFTDGVIMRIMDGLMAFPVILLAIALMAALGPSIWNVIMALSFVYAPRTARIVRGAVLSVKPSAYVEAAGAIGVRHARILFGHILPNCMSPVIVQATFVFAYAIQAEAALSFLGVGVPPDVPTWGIMLNEARLYMTSAPWIMLPPGIAIALIVLALNAVGDGLRDHLDPRGQK